MSETLFDTLEKPMSTELTTVEVSPMTLLHDAVREGMTPDQLAVLVGLQRDMTADAAKLAFAEAMHNAQMEMPVVVQDAANTHTKKRYASLETIQKFTKPIYSKHGFSMSFGEADCPIEGFKRTTCDVTHDKGHTRHYHIDLPIDSSGSMNKIQGCVSTTSYGQRRLCSMIWNITIAGEDNDAQGAIEKISHEQFATLDEWIETSGANRQKWLEAYEIKSVSELPANLFDVALQQLKRKHAQKR